MFTLPFAIYFLTTCFYRIWIQQYYALGFVTKETFFSISLKLEVLKAILDVSLQSSYNPLKLETI